VDYVGTFSKQETFLATDTVKTSKGLVYTTLYLKEGRMLGIERLFGILLFTI
jgi:hypothetical protein